MEDSFHLKTSSAQLTPESALAQMQQDRVAIIDVREPNEFQREHITGAISVPLSELTPERLPSGQAAIFYCGAGKRSCTAAQRLGESGYQDVAVIEGGITGWKEAGLPTTEAPKGMNAQKA